MAERRSVLDPKPKVIFADDRTLSPCVDWLSWRTWAVFLGFNIALAATASLVLLLCGYAILRMIDDSGWQYVTLFPVALAAAWIWYVGLRRVFPLRDKAGRRVPGNPKLDFLGSPVLVVFPWMVGFIWIFIEAHSLARNLVTVFAASPPLWVPGFAAPFSVMAFEIPYRVLWRAPVQEPDRND